MPNSLAIFVPENELAFRNLLISSPITLVKKFLGITLFKVKLSFTIYPEKLNPIQYAKDKWALISNCL